MLKRYVTASILAVAAAAAALAFATETPSSRSRYVIGAGLAKGPDDWVTVASLEPGWPGRAAGLAEGDQILAVNDARVTAPAEVGAALQSHGAAMSVLKVRRGEREFSLSVKPWVTPDPRRDAELFPYDDPKTVEPPTSFMARVGDRDYPVAETGEVFSLTKTLGVDSPRGRVAFRARLSRCADIVSLAGPISQPNADMLFPLSSARSLLFDYAAAADQRAACEAYMKENNLSLSSPRVVIAGRFVDDRDAALSDGGAVLLVDAVMFDHDHVTLGAQIVSALRFLNSTGLFSGE